MPSCLQAMFNPNTSPRKLTWAHHLYARCTVGAPTIHCRPCRVPMAGDIAAPWLTNTSFNCDSGHST